VIAAAPPQAVAKLPFPPPPPRAHRLSRDAFFIHTRRNLGRNYFHVFIFRDDYCARCFLRAVIVHSDIEVEKFYFVSENKMSIVSTADLAAKKFESQKL